ncbi:MAG: cysteine synthase A [Epulopiscium sp. Nele67-Bin001]|nr:MAG: cysteine synthase A [Epulopiscium sp. Nuni2H_MBin001]OON92353.1 MAG: cysteine synthase A [Epulopiscium sp. Nele67-Bin001]
MIYNNLFELIGNTPIVKINDPEVSGQLYAKLEFFNPGGSVKDRAALYMISGLKQKGIITDSTTIVEPTSGNTGIGVAMVAAALKVKCKLVMPESMSLERRAILKGYGAELVLTSAKDGMGGAIAKAKELAELDNHVILSQFTNGDNVLAHKSTTAKEIIRDFDKLDYFVAAIGTGGTITGVGEILKEHYKDITLISIEPETSPILTQGVKGPHKIQGIGAGFKPDILNLDIIDKILTISDEDAMQYARKLGAEHGILAGFSGGANYKIAYDIAKEASADTKVLFIVPDNGERYLSTALYQEE